MLPCRSDRGVSLPDQPVKRAKTKRLPSSSDSASRLAFSDSSSLDRRASDTANRPYLPLSLQHVADELPSFRQSSVIFAPYRTLSCSE